MKVFIKEEPLDISRTGKAYRVYRAEDKNPLYLGGETREEAEARLKEYFPQAVIVPEKT